MAYISGLHYIFIGQCCSKPQIIVILRLWGRIAYLLHLKHISPQDFIAQCFQQPYSNCAWSPWFRWAFLVAQMVKITPAMQETRVGSLGWEDSLDQGTATHSSILAWRMLWTEEPGRLQSTGLQTVGHDRKLSLGLRINFYSYLLEVLALLHLVYMCGCCNYLSSCLFFFFIGL